VAVLAVPEVQKAQVQKEVVERMNRLRRVQGAEAGEEAFEELLQFVSGKNLVLPRKLPAQPALNMH